jgi:succinate dehydrogenase / fumarate reductase cytochrome b subunit
MSSAKGGSSADVRPLSPHLQVYSMRINMLMSIVHRITGSALYFGTVILVAWLIAAAMGPDAYDFVAGLLGSWLGLAVLFLYTWALLHHMMGGIRHFIWDTGRGFDINSVKTLSIMSGVVSVVATLLIWGAVLIGG